MVYSVQCIVWRALLFCPQSLRLQFSAASASRALLKVLLFLCEKRRPVCCSANSSSQHTAAASSLSHIRLCCYNSTAPLRVLYCTPFFISFYRHILHNTLQRCCLVSLAARWLPCSATCSASQPSLLWLTRVHMHALITDHSTLQLGNATLNADNSILHSLYSSSIATALAACDHMQQCVTLDGSIDSASTPFCALHPTRR